MKGKKTFPGQEIRNTWSMNPVTRVHDNDPAKNKKKERQNARKTVEKEMNAFLREGRHDRKRWTDNNTDQRFFVGFTVSHQAATSWMMSTALSTSPDVTANASNLGASQA